MAIAYRSHSTVSGVDSTDAVFTKPSGLTAGDMMLVFIMTNGVVPDYSLSGWTKLADVDNSTNNGIELLAKVASSGDASATNFTFTYNGSFTGKNISGIMAAYSGTFTSSSNIIAIDSDDDADANDNDIGEWSGGITPQANSTLVMFGGASCTNSSTSSLSGYAITTSNPSWTERADFGNNNNSDTRIGFADSSRPEATATGAYQINFNSTGNVDRAFGVLLSLSETANGSVSPSVISVVSSVIAPSVTAGAVVSPAVISVASSIQSPTVSTPLADWSNVDKTSSTWTNQDKS